MDAGRGQPPPTPRIPPFSALPSWRRRRNGYVMYTQLYAQIRPAALKQAVEFYETKALDVLRP